jgi:hypothetical protein
MIAPIDIASLSAPAQKLLQPSAPPKLQEMAARGIAPGIKPAEMLAILLVLSAGERPLVKETAEKTLSALPEQLLTAALDADLAPAVLDTLARSYTERTDVLEKLIAMPRIAMETLEEVARKGSEKTTELLAVNEERLLAHPRLIELLYLNKKTRMSTADRIVELATRHGLELTGIAAWKEASAAIQNELIAEPSDEPTPDDLLFQEIQEIAETLDQEAAATGELEDTHAEVEEGKEVVKKRFVPLYKRIADMTVTQKIRRAMLGTKEERMLLVRDNNRLVASAAVRSPLMKESEAALLSRNRNVTEEVIRIIATTPEWQKSYVVKKNLVENPKTPVLLAMRLVTHLRESDLRLLAKSKNVTGPVQEAARRHLSRRTT